MAEDTREQDTNFVEPEGTITLVSPSGAEYRTNNAVEINNLVYGQGYRRKDDDTTAPDAPATAASRNEDSDPDTTDALTTEALAAPTPAPTTSSKPAAKATATKTPATGTPPSTA